MVISRPQKINVDQIDTYLLLYHGTHLPIILDKQVDILSWPRNYKRDNAEEDHTQEKTEEEERKIRACVRLDGQKAYRAWQESRFWQQLWPQFYILRWCLDSAPAPPSQASVFSIRGDHELLSAVITAVHCGPAEGFRAVLVHLVTLHRGTSDMGTEKDPQAVQGTTQKFKKRFCLPKNPKQMKTICCMRPLKSHLKE